MDKILHDPKDPKLWELWYIPYYGSCRILSINRSVRPWGKLAMGLGSREDTGEVDPCNRGCTILGALAQQGSIMRDLGFRV